MGSHAKVASEMEGWRLKGNQRKGLDLGAELSRTPAVLLCTPDVLLWASPFLSAYSWSLVRHLHRSGLLSGEVTNAGALGVGPVDITQHGFLWQNGYWDGVAHTGRSSNSKKACGRIRGLLPANAGGIINTPSLSAARGEHLYHHRN